MVSGNKLRWQFHTPPPRTWIFPFEDPWQKIDTEVAVDQRAAALRPGCRSLMRGLAMELDLGLASSFLVLAEEGHYGRAAARLHLTSPALTKRIQRLERQLGVELLQRGPAGVLRVTAAGLRFAEAAGPLLAHAEAARQAARQGPSRYTVRIGVPAGARPSLAGMGLAKIAHDLRRSYPEAHFTCHEIPFPELDQCLDDKTVDVLWKLARQ